MTADPLIPEDLLPATDGELLQRINQLHPLVVDVSDGAAGRALALALLFDKWPDLIDVGQPLDAMQCFYNQYFWFRRFAALWQAEHGVDAGIEQMAFDILDQPEGDVDWDLVQLLDERARMKQ